MYAMQTHNFSHFRPRLAERPQHYEKGTREENGTSTAWSTREGVGEAADEQKINQSGA